MPTFGMGLVLSVAKNRNRIFPFDTQDAVGSFPPQFSPEHCIKSWPLPVRPSDEAGGAFDPPDGG